MIYDMIYLTAIGLTLGGSSTVHIYKETIHRTTQPTKQYIEQCFNNNSGKATTNSFDACSNSLFISHSIIPRLTASLSKPQAMST